MAGNVFQLEIVTPMAKRPVRPVSAITLPGREGRMGILAGHQAMVAALARGTMSVSPETGPSETWSVDAGFVVVRREGVTVLVRSAEQEGAAAHPQ